MEMTVEQCRAGRALLNWSTTDLAAKAGIGVATAKRFESGQKVQPNSVALMRQTLENAGVTFIEDGQASRRGGPGVRLAEDV
jgi:transcriptional regulator with XRE-family HTH domain